MSALVNLYEGDGKMVVGRTSGSFPVSVNSGFALTGTMMTGYQKVTTARTVLLGWQEGHKRRKSYIWGTVYDTRWVPTYASIYAGGIQSAYGAARTTL